jgi:hypothetical protein
LEIFSEKRKKQRKQRYYARQRQQSSRQESFRKYKKRRRDETDKHEWMQQHYGGYPPPRHYGYPNPQNYGYANAQHYGGYPNPHATQNFNFHPSMMNGHLGGNLQGAQFATDPNGGGGPVLPSRSHSLPTVGQQTEGAVPVSGNGTGTPGYIGTAYNKMGSYANSFAGFAKPVIMQAAPGAIKTGMGIGGTALGAMLGPWGAVGGGYMAYVGLFN